MVARLLLNLSGSPLLPGKEPWYSAPSVIRPPSACSSAAPSARGDLRVLGSCLSVAS